MLTGYPPDLGGGTRDGWLAWAKAHPAEVLEAAAFRLANMPASKRAMHLADALRELARLNEEQPR